MKKLTNGTLNYNLTLEYILTPELILERNNFIPDYPDPNDLRFLTTPSVYTIENDSLYRDGELVGRIYNNKTGMLVEVTEVTDNTITVKDTEEQSNSGDIPLVVVLKLTGKEVVVTPPPIVHEYIEIAGIKWATMNLGANSVTDTGLYFAWGETLGYSKNQIGVDKQFSWEDYTLANGSSSSITKYNSTDNLTVLQYNDDAVSIIWGDGWRLPTKEEFILLGNSVNVEWTDNYLGSGVSGIICTDKTNNSKALFFPASGFGHNGSMGTDIVKYWSNSLFTDYNLYAYNLNCSNNGYGPTWDSYGYDRANGFPLRGVYDPYNGHEYIDLGLPSGTKWATVNVGAITETGFGNYYMYGKGLNTYNSSDQGYIGDEDPLSLNVDTARQAWGGIWHMPTSELLLELISNTTYLWTSNYLESGISGGTFTANGLTLFIPAAGYYGSNGNLLNVNTMASLLSSTPSENGGCKAFFCGNGNGYEYVAGLSRIQGNSVRPVIG